ncbi:MAG: hypothetical protein JKY93_04730 [Gammaproteobacteria bacterium]|nr:hypothetical protein [Gammaproteobacteria bacterium]
MRTLFALFTLLSLCTNAQAASLNGSLDNPSYTSASVLNNTLLANEEEETEEEYDEGDEEPDCE